MEKYKLISSIFSLILTISLTFTLIFAWYTSNDEVSVSGVVASTNEDLCQFKLEYFDDGWMYVDDLTFNNMWPSDVVYFRLVATPKTDIQIKAKFMGITSMLFSDIACDGNNIFLNSNPTVNLYKINNDKVMIDNKILYSIDSNNNIFLKDFLIEDAFSINLVGYSILQYTPQSYPNITTNDFTYINQITNLDEEFLNITLDSTTYIYFNVCYRNDNVLESEYNYYAFQSLAIQSLDMKVMEG